MGKTKELNIKNQTYYYFNGIINKKNFQSNLLKIDKKSHRDIYYIYDIYYINYDTVKNFSNCKDICSVNPLYLLIYSATGYLKEKNGEKYLIINSTEKYDEVFSGIISEIKTINGEKELSYEKKICKN